MSRWSNSIAVEHGGRQAYSAPRVILDKKSAVAAALTVICASGLSAVAGPKDGMTIRLTPIVKTIEGCYGPV